MTVPPRLPTESSNWPTVAWSSQHAQLSSLAMASQLLLFRFLNVSALATHRLRTALSALGVALGVALVLGVLIFNNSLTGSFTLITRDLRGGANLEVTTDSAAGLEESLVDQVRSTAGV